MAKGVLVFVETVRGGLSLGTREALALGRALADAQGVELNAALLAAGPSLAAEAIYHGADVAYLLAAPLLEAYQPEPYADVAEQVCHAIAPQVILLPHSPFGCDLAPRLAFRLGIPWAAGCLEVRAAERGAVVTRPFVGGKVLLEEEANFPLAATLRAKSVEPLGRDISRAGEVRQLALAARNGSERLRHLEGVEKERGISEELAEASVIVSGGLGMGSQEGFARLAELASLLRASLAGSKAAVDRGWVEAERQVGLTGVAVAPRLYLAVGVSGSTQHMAGCSKSKTIVAINKDPAANIFKFCKYGIVMEWERALPLLLAELGEAGTAER